MEHRRLKKPASGLVVMWYMVTVTLAFTFIEGFVAYKAGCGELWAVRMNGYANEKQRDAYVSCMQAKDLMAKPPPR